MHDRTLITTGAIGAVLAAICCLTPLLVVVFGAIGLTAWLAKADYVLIPALILCLAPIAFGLLPQALAPRMTNNALKSTMILESVITCPHCATAKSEIMPTDACQFFYTCTGCGATLRPKPGDCCVFCSYGSVPCPPIQAERSHGKGPASCCSG